MCPPLPRVPSTHHLHGEGPAEEVFFTKPGPAMVRLTLHEQIKFGLFNVYVHLKLMQANGGVASSGLGGGLGGDGRSGVLGGLAGLGGDAGVSEDASGGGIGGATGRHHPRPPPNYTSDPYR